MHVRYLDHYCFEPGVDKPDIGEEVESGVAGNKAVYSSDNRLFPSTVTGNSSVIAEAE